jgi:hypothetical protein
MAQNKALRLGGIGAPCCCGPGGCRCLSGVCVETCAGVPINGAIVTIGSLPSAPTVTQGCRNFCLDLLGGPGSYQVKVTATGYTSYSNTRALACNGTIFVKLVSTPDANTILFTITGCCNLPLPGATVTFAGQTYTTDANGKATATFGVSESGTFTWTVSKTRFATQTGSLTFNNPCPPGGALAPINVTLAPASGYHCAPQTYFTNPPVVLVDPAPDTLHGTDSVYGAFTLNWNHTAGLWDGYSHVQHPADCGCPAQQMQIYYNMSSCPGGTGLAVGGVSKADNIHCNCFCLCDPTTDVTCQGGINKGGGLNSETLSPTIPFNYTGFAPAPQPCVAGTSGDRMYPQGAHSWTVTE